MNLTLMIALAVLAGARTWRLMAIDCAGKLIRFRFDSLVWAINPPALRATPYPRRKDVSKLNWRRHRVAKSLSEGYNCPYCLGFWLCLAWVGTGLAWSDTWPWQLAAGSFAASYVAGHLGSHLDAGNACDDDD
jgi:hypothetical protein